MNMRTKTSPVWNYFSYSGVGKYAECQICYKPASLGSEIKKSQTTSNLKRHLQSVHKGELEITEGKLNKAMDPILKVGGPDMVEKNIPTTTILPPKLNFLIQAGNISVIHQESSEKTNQENDVDFTGNFNYKQTLKSLVEKGNNLTVFKNKSKLFSSTFMNTENNHSISRKKIVFSPLKKNVHEGYKFKKDNNHHNLSKGHNDSGASCYCDSCGELFSTAFHLKSHIKDVHEGHQKLCENDKIETFICFICKEKFEHNVFQVHFPECASKQEKDQTNLKLPADVIKNVHKGHKLCDTCGKSFADSWGLERHLHTVHNVHEGHKDYKCDFCGKAFTNSADLKKHVSLIHEENGKCEICGKSFSSPQNMKRHIQIVHEKRKNYVCDICGKFFSEKGGLKKHRLAYHDQSYKCEFCNNKLFYSATSLKSHIYIVHEGHRDYTCDTCGKSFSQPQGLKRHKLGVHEGIKNHKCDTCSKSFMDNSKLQEHIRTVHEKRKDYACELCEKAFSTAAVLRKHISVHRNQDKNN